MEEWCIKHGLSEDAVKILKDEAFDTIEALQCMDCDDLEALPLRRGHKAILRKSLLEVNESCSVNTLKSSVQHHCRESDKKVSELFSGLKLADNASSSKGENYLKITDFIPQGIIVEEEMSIGGGVVLKLPGARAKLEKVSPSAWITGNAKIMMALSDRHDFSIKDYIKYTAMIGELGCRFTWQSVLVFDDEYRQRQHRDGFRWGSEAPHLSTVVLRDRPLSSSKIQIGQRQRAMPSAKKDICLQFNRGACSYGLRCIYQHVCSTCGKDHPFVLHTSSASSTPPTGYSA